MAFIALDAWRGALRFATTTSRSPGPGSPAGTISTVRRRGAARGCSGAAAAVVVAVDMAIGGPG